MIIVKKANSFINDVSHQEEYRNQVIAKTCSIGVALLILGLAVFVEVSGHRYLPMVFRTTLSQYTMGGMLGFGGFVLLIIANALKNNRILKGEKNIVQDELNREESSDDDFSGFEPLTKEEIAEMQEAFKNSDAKVLDRSTMSENAGSSTAIVLENNPNVESEESSDEDFAGLELLTEKEIAEMQAELEKLDAQVLDSFTIPRSAGSSKAEEGNIYIGLAHDERIMVGCIGYGEGVQILGQNLSEIISTINPDDLARDVPLRYFFPEAISYNQSLILFFIDKDKSHFHFDTFETGKVLCEFVRGQISYNKNGNKYTFPGFLEVSLSDSDQASSHGNFIMAEDLPIRVMAGEEDLLIG